MSTRTRRKIVKLLADYFLEQGKVPASRQEYSEMKNVPVRISQFSCYFGAWGAVVNAIKAQEPEVWAKIHAPKPKAAPKPAPKPVAPKPAPTPKVASKPVPKPVVNKEK